MNIHVPQTIEAYAETEELLSIANNLMSDQTNRPMMGIVYDSLTGAYLLTQPEHQFDKLSTEIELIRDELAKHPIDSEKYAELNASMHIKVDQWKAMQNELTLNAAIQQLREQIQRYPEDSQEYIDISEAIDKNMRLLFGKKTHLVLDPIVFDQGISEVMNSPQYITLKERLFKYGVQWGTGRALFSATLPEDFDYIMKIKDNHVVIKEGVLISGFMNKDILGTKDGSIIAEMYKQLGGDVTVTFMSEVQFVLREFLQQRGFSVGIDDCIPNDPALKDMIESKFAEAQLKVISLTQETTNKILAEQQERKIMETLDIAKTMGESIASEYLKPDNALLIMANSGAKGSAINIAQIISGLGQIKVSNQRIPANLPGNRSLPVFEPNDLDPRAKGFCINSFSSGLTPSEFFFHAQGGREGLTDTAINTAQTGMLQHQIIKAAEDIHISADGSVRDAINTIVQFVYSDGFDAGELGSVNIRGEKIPFFRNLDQLANKINRKYSQV